MELITIATLSSFIATCLNKAGEKFSEKVIESVFEHKRELADKFTDLFKQEIITLGLNNSTTSEKIQEQLEAHPEAVSEILKKITNNPELLADFNEQLIEHSNGITINAKNIGLFINKNEGTITQNNTFS